MKLSNRVGFVVALVAAVLLLAWLRPATSSAQPSAGGAAPDVAALLGRSLATQVVTLKVEDQRGEPRIVMGTAKFDRPVVAYWINVVGADIKFGRNTEKQINRQLFSVDPFAKIINGKELQVSGKLGIRDGSGDWDDTYEGTLTVAVTAVLANQ